VEEINKVVVLCNLNRTLLAELRASYKKIENMIVGHSDFGVIGGWALRRKTTHTGNIII